MQDPTMVTAADMTKEEAKRRIHGLPKDMFDVMHSITAERLRGEMSSRQGLTMLGLPMMVDMLGEKMGVPVQHQLEALVLISWYTAAYGDQEGARELTNDLVDEYAVRRQQPEYAQQRRQGCLGSVILLLILLPMSVWLILVALRY